MWNSSQHRTINELNREREEEEEKRWFKTRSDLDGKGVPMTPETRARSIGEGNTRAGEREKNSRALDKRASGLTRDEVEVMAIRQRENLDELLWLSDNK